MIHWSDLPDGKAKYEAYLASREWAVLREAVWNRSGGHCERCQCEAGIDGQVHHDTYERKYHEKLEDLRLLCPGCHCFLSAKSDVDPASWMTSPDTIEYNCTLMLKDLGINDPLSFTSLAATYAFNRGCAIAFYLASLVEQKGDPTDIRKQLIDNATNEALLIMVRSEKRMKEIGRLPR